MSSIEILNPLVVPFARIAPETAARVAEHLATHPRRSAIRRAIGRWQRQDPDRAEMVTFRFGRRALRWGRSGPSVLALHGWEGHPGQFSRLGESAAAAGFRLFALFGPGHSDPSDRCAHPALFRDALVEAAADLDDVAAVVGHSMGAGAMLLALAEGLPTGAAVSIAGPSGYAGVLERIGHQLGLPRPALDRFMQRMETRTGMALDSTLARRLMPRIGRPVLVVHDQHDPIVPFDDALDLSWHATNARLYQTSGLGHGRVLRDPTVVEQVIDFIQLETGGMAK